MILKSLWTLMLSDIIGSRVLYCVAVSTVLGVYKKTKLLVVIQTCRRDAVRLAGLPMPKSVENMVNITPTCDTVLHVSLKHFARNEKYSAQALCFWRVCVCVRGRVH